MQPLAIDTRYLTDTLLELLAVPSPTGMTDEIVHVMGKRLSAIGLSYELTRRGNIRAVLRSSANPGADAVAVVSHLDTLGAMVREVKANGRLALSPVGTWSSRWAEGGRVTVFSTGSRVRGTVLPLLASGHVYNEACDSQPVTWAQIEVRLDEAVDNAAATAALGVEVGDFVAFDPNPEVLANGFIVSRYLDDKAGVAAVLAALKALVESGEPLPADCHAVFTLTEECGTGARAVIEDSVAEIIAVDIGPVAPGQGARETGVTVPLMDSAGPHDYRLTRGLIDLCRRGGIAVHRDVFRFYHSDAGAAVSAGSDARTALLCFGTDATHGYERTHISALADVARALTLYLRHGPLAAPL